MSLALKHWRFQVSVWGWAVDGVPVAKRSLYYSSQVAYMAEKGDLDGWWDWTAADLANGMLDDGPLPPRMALAGSAWPA